MAHAEGYKYEDLKIGMSAENVHTITENDIDLFAQVSGDRNPLHMDEEFASKTMFGKRIAHGALSASFISGILGNDLPGPGSVFIGLSMRFRRPVFIGDEVTARAEVAEKLDKGNRVTLKVSCLVDGKRCIAGEAQVVVPSRDSE